MLEIQFQDFLARLILPNELESWAMCALESEVNSRREQFTDQAQAMERLISDCDRRAESLIDMRSRALIDDEEFTTKREAVRRERMRLEEALAKQRQEGAVWFEPARTVISFSNHATSWFAEGTEQEKRLIMRAVGSNLTLRQKIVSIQARKIYRHMPRSPKFPELRAFVESIRKSAVNGAIEEPLAAIRKVEASRAARLGLPHSAVADSEPCARSEAAAQRSRRAGSDRQPQSQP